MWKVIVTDMNGGMLLESLVDTERKTQKAVGEYLSSKDVNLDGVNLMKIEKIYIDEKEFENKKLYEQLQTAQDALKQIAQLNTHDRGFGDDLWLTHTCMDIAQEARQQIKEIEEKAKII